MAKARRRTSTDIAYAKIFPPIGIARVGDSENEFFYGPEFLAAHLHQEQIQYKDSEGRIKRQAARFRIYGFSAQGRVVGEITSNDATITWTVHLANKKAAWFNFDGAAKTLL